MGGNLIKVSGKGIITLLEQFSTQRVNRQCAKCNLVFKGRDACFRISTAIVFLINSAVLFMYTHSREGTVDMIHILIVFVSLLSALHGSICGNRCRDS